MNFATPWTVTLFLRDLSEASLVLDGGRFGDWRGIVSRCARWEFCKTRAERIALARDVVKASRFYVGLGGGYYKRLALYYRAMAFAMFAGARASPRDELMSYGALGKAMRYEASIVIRVKGAS